MRRPARLALAALSLLTVAPFAPETAHAEEAPSAAAALEQWLAVYNGQDAGALERFARDRYQPAWLAQSSPHQLAVGYRNWFANYGAFTLTQWIARSPLSAEAVVYSPALDACHGAFVEMDRTAPELIEGVYLEPFTRRDCPQAQAPASWREFSGALRGYLDALTVAGRFDGVVLVRRAGQTLVHEARGRASLAPVRRIHPNTRFELASVSKLFTAVAVGRLVEEERLSYDDTVAALVPDYPDSANASRITVRQLLAHMSGVEDYYRNGAIFSDSRTRAQLEEFWPLFAGRALTFEPGARYDYSNSNYVLLGSIIERVSGERFESFVSREIFQRARMTGACYCRPGARRTATPLTVYTAGAGPMRRVSPDGLMQTPVDAARPAPPAGYALASARDMARFAESLMDGALLSRAGFERMLEAQTPMDDGGHRGLGFEIYDFDGVRIVGHGGNSWGVSTQLDIYPEADIVVVILSNLEGAGAAALRYKTRRWISRLASH